LQRAYPWWRKYIVFLSGRELVISLAYRCRNHQCREARRGRMHTSHTAARLTLRGSSFALEVIAQIGYWRFWQRWTLNALNWTDTVCQPCTHAWLNPAQGKAVAL
jgi:hypothetical protein